MDDMTGISPVVDALFRAILRHAEENTSNS